MKIDLTKPIEVVIERDGVINGEHMFRAQSIGLNSEPEAEAYRRLFENAPKMLAWMKHECKCEDGYPDKLLEGRAFIAEIEGGGK